MSAKFSLGRRRTALAPAALAALFVGAAVAGCGPAASSTASDGLPVSTVAADTSSQGSTAGDSPPAAPPTTASSPAPQPNPAFPYDPNGVTFNGGVGGGVDAFSLPAGAYSENTVASYNPATDASGSGECLFSGEIDIPSGSGYLKAPLGGDAPITAMSPIEGPPVKYTLAAGDYKIYIYPETTCTWTIELWP
jgi:hypothetical protein